MSTELDGIFVPLAYELISEFGTAVTLTETTRGAKNFDTGVVAAGTDTAYSIKGIISKYTAHQVQWGSTDEKSVKFGDKKVLIYAQDLPETLDENTKLYTLTIDSVIWNVVTVTAQYSGDDISYYELQVRR